MRKLIEDTVYKNFTVGLNEIHQGTRGTALEAYLMPMEEMAYKQRIEWSTELRLRDIRRLLTLLSNEQLLTCLTEQDCDRFR